MYLANSFTREPHHMCYNAEFGRLGQTVYP